MRKSIISLLVVVLVVSILAVPGQTAYAQISLPADINKTFTPPYIAVGGTSLLRIIIFNPNTFPLTNASWRDEMPPELRVVGLVSNTCEGNVTATPGSSLITLSGGIVPEQSGSTPASCAVSVNVTSSTEGAWLNQIPPNGLSAQGPGGIPITNAKEARITLTVTGTGAPTVTKSFNPGTILAGAVSRLSITISNNDASRSLTQVSLTDDLPAGVSLADPVSPSLSGCGASAALTAVSGTSSVTLDNGTIAPSASCVITVNVTSNVQGAYDNTIPAQSLRTNENLTNRTPATARLNVQELDVNKNFAPGTLEAGGTAVLTITLVNPKSSPYTGVHFLDELPSPMTVAGPVTNGCNGTISTSLPPPNPPNTIVELTGGIIPAGTPANPGTCTISVPVTVPVGTPTGRLTNRIPARGVITDQGIRNLQPGTANVTVSGTTFGGIKSFSPSTIQAGGNSRLRIELTAPSDTNLTNVSMTDTLPTGVAINNPDSATQNANCIGGTLSTPPGSRTITWTGGTINAGQTCRIDVNVTSNSPTPPGSFHTNTIPPGNITNDQNRTLANPLTANLTVTGSLTLGIAVSKHFDPPEVFGGASSLMSIDLINTGNVTLTNIRFTDNMPNGMILANPVNLDVGTCGGALSGAPGANSFSFSGGSLPPFERCTITLRATMTVNSNLVNVINAGDVQTDNGVSNALPVEATLTNQPGASISKVFSPNPIPAGSFSLLTITIQNTGTIELTGMGLSDSLPAGLVIAGGAVPAPVNNCGGTFTAIPGTQLVQLAGGSLIGNSACTMVVAVTGSNTGEYENIIREGSLITDPSLRVTNLQPAIDRLVITGTSGGGGGGSGGGRGRGNNNPSGTTTTTGAFLIPVTGFAPGRATNLDPASRTEYNATSLEIEIPVLKVKTSIVGVESRNGNWDVAWLQNQVGWLNGTAYPTWKGNSLLTAHVVNADGKPGVFSKLKSLGTGEFIYVYSAGYRYTYQVVSNVYVQPDDASVIRHEEKSYLTLITCDSFDEKTGTYLRRVAVRAVLVDVRTVR